MNAPPIRIVVADDHEILRSGLISVFEKMQDLYVAGECSNGRRLVDLALKLRPDVIICDIKMPLMDGIEATRIIRQKLPCTQIIAFSFLDNEYAVVNMLEAGAMGYLVKDSSKEEMMEAIHTVHKGKPYYCDTSNALLTRLINESRFDPYKNQNKVMFDEKELEIIRFFCEQKTCQQVAALMNKSVRTIEEYRGRIFDKMGVKNLAGMVIYAVKTGIYEVI